MTATTTMLRSGAVLAELFTADDPSPEALKLAESAVSSDEGGEIIAEAFNNLLALWHAACGNDDDGEIAMLARTIADAGLRLRTRALELGLIEALHGSYVVSGPALYAADTALYRLRKALGHFKDETGKGGAA